MDPIYPFLIVGAISYSGIVSCYKVERARPTQQPVWAWSTGGKLWLHIMGMISLLSFVAALWFGFVHLKWWIPLVFVFLIFPALHVFLLTKMFGEILGSIVFPVATAPLAIWLFIEWF